MSKNKTVVFKNLEEFLSFAHDEVIDCHGFDIDIEDDPLGFNYGIEDSVISGILRHIAKMEASLDDQYDKAIARNLEDGNQILSKIQKLDTAKEQVLARNLNSYSPQYRALGDEFVKRMERYEEILRIHQNNELTMDSHYQDYDKESLKYLAVLIDGEMFEVEVYEQTREDDSKYKQSWFKEGKLHRDDNAAVIISEGRSSSKLHYDEGKLLKTIENIASYSVSSKNNAQELKFMGAATLEDSQERDISGDTRAGKIFAKDQYDSWDNQLSGCTT